MILATDEEFYKFLSTTPGAIVAVAVIAAGCFYMWLLLK